MQLVRTCQEDPKEAMVIFATYDFRAVLSNEELENRRNSRKIREKKELSTLSFPFLRNISRFCAREKERERERDSHRTFDAANAI